MSTRVNFLTPVGRLVMGSCYKPSTKDADGNALVYKSGKDIGQPRVNYFLALAIPKGPETHWSQTTWGAEILAVAAAAFPQAHRSPTFAWKVTDGDDTIPNTRGKRACDTEGFPGHWIMRFSGSYAPKVFREENGAYVQVTEENYILPGYYVQVSGSISGNGSQQRPGLYLNHSMVAFTAYGQEIHFGPDANSVGFGQAPLPAGALRTPVASSAPLPGFTQTTHAPAAVAQVLPSTPASVVQPNHAFLAAVPPPLPAGALRTPVASSAPLPGFPQVPQAAPVPAVTAVVPPPPPPASTVPAATTSPSNQMTAKAAGSSYQSFKTAGWTDEALVLQGYMTV